MDGMTRGNFDDLIVDLNCVFFLGFLRSSSSSSVCCSISISGVVGLFYQSKEH
jgi:hypothetical protein